MQDRIIEMLGRGLPTGVVADACGVSDSYVSQILSENLEVITEERSKHFQQFVDHDEKINSLEEAALAKVEQLLPFSTKIGEITRVFRVLNEAKRRTAGNINPNASNATVVELILPESATVRFTKTTESQVVEIEGRTIATLPAKSLAARLEKKQATRLLELAVPGRLPVSALSEKF